MIGAGRLERPTPFCPTIRRTTAPLIRPRDLWSSHGVPPTRAPAAKAGALSGQPF